MYRTPRRGRPSRAESSQRALADVDLAALDLDLLLRRIAADESLPAASRVAAIKLLREDSKKEKPAAVADLNTRAIARAKHGARS